MGLSFKNISHPSKWDLTGDNKDAEGLRDALNGATAANAAKKQEKAAEKAASEGIAYLKEGADKGYGFIDQGTGQAAGSLTQGGADALSALYDGRDQAAGALQGAPNRLSDLYNGGLAAGFQTDPGYQFRLQQGMDAIEHSAAARGGRAGGDTLKALNEYGRNFASNEFNNYTNRQIGLAGGADQGDWRQGSSLADLYAGTGANAANLASGQGSALANLYSGAGTNKANLAIGAAGQSANLGMAPVQYAGGADRAKADAYGNIVGLGVAAGTKAAFA